MSAANETTAARVRRMIVETLPATAEANPKIFGAGAPLDSLGLVNFLADLEYRISTEFGREVVLASEQAMSRSRSPFRDADALTEYVVELLNP